MKKNVKTVLTAAAIFVSAGLVLCGVAFAAVGFDYTALSTADESSYMTRQEEFDAASVDKIDIGIDVDGIKVKTSSDGKIHLTCTDRDNLKYYIDRQDGVLGIQQTNKERGSIFRLFSFSLNFRNTDAVLELPEDFEGDLVIQSDVGDVTLTELTLAGAVDISLGTGKMSSDGLNAKTVSVKSNVGDIKCQNWTVEQTLFLETKTGDVVLDNSTVEEDLTAQSKVGKVKVKNTQAKTMAFTTKTGDIVMELLTADNYKLSTNVGDIRGSLCGEQQEYTILTATVVGESNPTSQKGTTEKEVSASTQTGDIKLTFQP